MKNMLLNLLLSAVLIIGTISCGLERSEKFKGDRDAIESSTDYPEENSATEQHKNIPKIKSGHIVMMVSDLDKSQQFYQEHLGLHTNEELVYEGLRRIFMSGSDSHHELVLLESRVSEFPHKDKRQLQQVAFELSSHEALVEYYKHIKETDIPYVIKDNQVSLSLYFPDPDGVTVELYWDITKQSFGEKMWGGNQEDISEEAFLNPFEEMRE